jgi:glycosyltransferase involved in cell wall biosynthesis
MNATLGPLVLAIPTFNSAQFLARTLQSVNANGPAVRWWLQDGASTDGTLAIARSFARADDTIVSEPDLGQTDALNRAMKNMGGEIVGFINGDDCLVPGTAARVVEYFAAHPQIDLLYGGVEWIDEEDQVAGKHFGRISSLGEVLDIYNVWWKERQWVQPEVFYRRSLWERVGGFNTGYRLAFDYDFWVRCFLANAVVARQSETFAQFRRHSAQKSTAARDAADEIRAIVEKNLALNPPIAAGTRWRLRAQLSYDRYQLGDQLTSGARRPSFFSALLRHPHWLLASHVRTRLQNALGKVVFGTR